VPSKSIGDLVARATEILNQTWQEVRDLAAQGLLQDPLHDATLVQAIRRSVTSRTRTYRYVLPTQLLAKLADSSLDCRSVQVGSGAEGAFDARSVAHKVVVPFDADNHNVLGGSPEPYVSNPLRVPKVSSRYAAAQKNKHGWSDLCRVLDAAQKSDGGAFVERLFRQTLVEVHRQLAAVHVTYPVPIRISLERTILLTERFMAELSGGDRAQAVASALFLTIGRKFGLYNNVRRATINTADAASGLVADLECLSERGEIVVVAEIKDKELTLGQIEAKLQGARAKKVSEIFFIVQKGAAACDHSALAARTEAEFASGQNFYILDLAALARVALALLGEDARREFLGSVGQQLDDYKSDIRHRQDWRDSLASL